MSSPNPQSTASAPTPIIGLDEPSGVEPSGVEPSGDDGTDGDDGEESTIATGAARFVRDFVPASVSSVPFSPSAPDPVTFFE